MIKNAILFTVLLGLGFVSCNNDDDVMTDNPTLNFGEVLTISQDLEVEFSGIEDSRCPADVQCIWQGVAKVTLTIRQDDQMDEILLCDWDTNGIDEECETIRTSFGYEFELLEVNPYPQEANNLPDPQAYSIVIRADKL